MLLFAPTHSAALAHRIAAILGRPLGASEEREFGGGEHKMRPIEEVRGEDVFILQSLCGDATASANDKLCRMLFFSGALKDAGAARLTACIPYLAYARKDRRTQSRDPVTTRYVAALLEAVGIDRVVVLEVHNDAAFDNAFRCETVRLDAVELFAGHLSARAGDVRLVIASPDTGGIKRADRLRQALEQRSDRRIDLAFMEKRRASGVVSGSAFAGEVAGREVVFFDDMIASGTTILRAAHAARRAGAERIDVLATHAAFLPGTMTLFDDGAVDSVTVTDSIALPHAFEQLPPERLSVLSIAPLFAGTIRTLARNGERSAG